MRTRILQDNAAFFGKQFRADLAELGQVTPEIRGAIGAWLSNLHDIKDYADAETWIPISRETGRTIEDLKKLVQPAFFIAQRSAEARVEIEDLISDLQEAGILDPSTEHLTTAIRQLSMPLLHLLYRARTSVSHGLPLLYLQRIRARTIFVSTFDREFDLKADRPSAYQPGLEALHPHVVLELGFKDSDETPIGILLSPQDLRTLRRWLEFAEVQLRTAATNTAKAKVIYEEPKDG